MIAANTYQGGGGDFFSRPDNTRSDARMIAKLVSLGVVKESTARKLLRKGLKIAAQTNKARDYAAVMKIVIECAKLETSAKDILPADDSASAAAPPSRDELHKMMQSRFKTVGHDGAKV